MRTGLLLALLVLGCFQSLLQADPIFLEAESFVIHGSGWRIQENAQARRASGVKVLNGAMGDVNSTASHEIHLPTAGRWRIWVRYMSHDRLRGPFEVEVQSGEAVLASHTFDQQRQGKVPQWDYVWDHLEADLPAGGHRLVLRKHQQKNASSYVRNVDALLLTQDLKREPDHVPFGPQTWMRVTLTEAPDQPVYIHIFADHYRSPWYAHYALSREGFERGLRPGRKDGFLNAENLSTGWLNISETIYQDSGARLVISPRYTYHRMAAKFKGTIEVAAAPDEASIVRRFEIDQTPAPVNLIVPSNLLTDENRIRLRRDSEMAAEIGAVADRFSWPVHGRKPVKFPFFVSAKIDSDSQAREVVQRELKTLAYFGFSGIGRRPLADEPDFPHQSIGGVGWFYDQTFSRPQLDRIASRAEALYRNLVDGGWEADRIAFAQVMDEPTGQPATLLASDEASQKAFREWVGSKGLSPKDLLVSDWEQVRLIPEAQRDQFPALHYYTQQFRTVALGRFIEIQKQYLHQHWQKDFPVNVNFSDGAVYYANFYGQGVDYFTLLRETDQNALWSEDWSNRSSTYHCASFNVELMRAAAREGGQHLGHHLIAYAGRTGYDIRLKAISQVARGIKVLKSYAYGPLWAGHDLSAWQQHPHLWHDHASVIREIGAVEDDLLSAMPAAAEVAILYSSAADIWAQPAGDNLHGFERMHTWLALTHAQIPVDILHEGQVERGLLEGYRVCYLNTPHLTGAAAEKLAHWVRRGGTLVLTAGAGQKDEFNRPLTVLDELAGSERHPLETLQKHLYGGVALRRLQEQEMITCGDYSVAVLGARQRFARWDEEHQVRASFSDGSPALIATAAGKGQVLTYGFMPALDYIRQALLARDQVVTAEPEAGEQEDERPDGVPGAEAILTLRLDQKSYNPWQYSAGLRKLITSPVQEAGVEAPIRCSDPVVETIYMVSSEHPNVLIPLANYTLTPIADLKLEIATDRPVQEVVSVHQGALSFEYLDSGRIRIRMPLEATDFVLLKR